MLRAGAEIYRIDAEPRPTFHLSRRDPEPAAPLHSACYLCMKLLALGLIHIASAIPDADRRHSRPARRLEVRVTFNKSVQSLRQTHISIDPVSNLSRPVPLKA